MKTVSVKNSDSTQEKVKTSWFAGEMKKLKRISFCSFF